MSVHPGEPTRTPSGNCPPASLLLHRSLLHKRASAEVLIGSPRRTDDGAAFTVELPPTHSTVRGGSTKVPPVLMLEAVRQLGIATAHCLLSASLEWAFIANGMSLHWLTEPVCFPTFGPIELEAEVEAADVPIRNGTPAGLPAHASLGQGGHTVAHAEGRLTFVPPRTYRAIRHRAHLSSSRDTRPDPQPLRHVRQAPGQLTAQVGWDWRNRFYFDHDADHVPGMVIAAAACEAQRLLSDGPDPSTLQMEFSRYAELDLPIDVAACTKGGARPPVFVTLSQAGEAIGDATFGS